MSYLVSPYSDVLVSPYSDVVRFYNQIALTSKKGAVAHGMYGTTFNAMRLDNYHFPQINLFFLERFMLLCDVN